MPLWLLLEILIYSEGLVQFSIDVHSSHAMLSNEACLEAWEA